MDFSPWRKLVLSGFTMLMLLAYSATAALAATAKQVLIIDMPRLTFEDVQPKYPNLFKLCQSSAVGILASRLTGVATPEKLYLNLNSGQQLWSVEDSRYILNANEIYNEVPAGQLYRSLTGYQAKAGGGVYLGLPKTIQLNAKNIPNPDIGIIGQTLHQYGYKTAVIGNADTAELLNRAGAILLLDKQGLIDLSAVGRDTTVKAPNFPSGLRSDNTKIYEYWQQFKRQAQVISISLGDLERLERFRDYIAESRKAYFRQQALRDYDRLLGRLLKDIDRANTMVILYSVIAPEIEGRGQRLSPAIIVKPDLKPGLMLSNSTRRPGLLTGPDLIATMFSFLKIQNHGYFAGRVIQTLQGDWRRSGALLKELDLNYQARWTLLPVHGYALIIAVVLLIFGLIFWPANCKFFQTLQQFYLFLLTIPAICLLEAIVSPVEWPQIVGWTLGLAAGLFVLAKVVGWKSERAALIVISAITLSLIILDGLRNGMWELRSFWGYSAISAARFYGVGNEYLGFLLGSYIVLLTLTQSYWQQYKHKTWFLWFGCFGMAFFLFCPVFGANIGGGIAALIGLGLANFFWLGYNISPKKFVILIGALLMMLALVGLSDFLIFGKQMSHFGQYLRLIQEQGFSAITEMVSRKWQLNMSLIAYNGASYILLGILTVIPFLYKNPPRTVARLIDRFPDLTKGILGFVSTCIVAFLVNDSGIVTVATMFIFGFDMILVTIIQECHSKELN